jgi:Protein of unknown function (DUF2867)
MSSGTTAEPVNQQEPHSRTAARVRRVEVPQGVAAIDAVVAPGYSKAWELPSLDAHALTPEQWVRRTWEDASRFLRWFLPIGWAGILRLRLGPRPSPDHILGWRISACDSGSITVEARSRLLTAHNIVVVNESSIVWVTLVRYDKRIGGLVWAVIAPTHRLLLSYALKRAGQTRSRSRA